MLDLHSMCGRYTQTATAKVIAQQFGVPEPPLFKPRYNIAPTQPVAVVRLEPDTSTRTLVMLRWGLIPSWAKDSRIGNQCINAKAETVAEKPAFRSSFSKRRCLVIADGFYEWKPERQHKQPFYISMKDRQPFAFAGLWARWEPPEADPIESCTTITTDPNDLLASIHNRMPVILDPMAYECWLDPTFRNPDFLKSVLRPFPADQMMAVAVSTLVNSPKHDVPQCLEPVAQ